MTLSLPRPRRIAIAATLSLLFGLLGSINAVTAVNVTPGTLGGFEADGNMTPTASNTDWTNITSTPIVDDTLDSGFQGSSKEEEPAGWTCNVGGASPGKGNILRAYANLSVTASPAAAFLNLSFVRQDGNGDAHVNFEFNKVATPPPSGADCPLVRSVGDFLVTYDFPGGSSPAAVRAWTWDGTEWDERALSTSDAAAASNTSAITDALSGQAAVGVREFGELSLNLMAAGLSGVVGCPAKAAVLNVRSRSSESITSALQDKVPTTQFSLDTCGKIVLHKVDNHVPANALGGATFGLYANATASGAPMATCLSSAAGTCTFNSVAPGSYSVKETAAPAGYQPDPSVRTVTVGFSQTVDVATRFVDPRDTGFVHIVKQLRDGAGHVVAPADTHTLDGTTFVMYRDANSNGALDLGETAALWPDEVAPAFCTVMAGAGSCDIGPLPTGSYRIHETVTPVGTTAGPDVNVTIQKGDADHAISATYVNLLPSLNIGLVKSGPATAHVGDVVTYTFSASTSGPRLHGVSLVDLVPTGCTTPLVGPTSDNGDGFLIVGESWQWTCNHTISAPDGDPVVNTARVAGFDDFGRTVNATDSHSVDVIHPAITVVKTGAATAHAGDVVSYSFAVTNTGDVVLAGIGVTDNKLGSVGTIASLAVGATTTLTKDFTVPAGTAVDNVATACGKDPLQLEVCDTDDHHLVVIHPAITVEKSGPATAHAGDIVTYSFAVTNTGDVPLTAVAVSDDKVGAIGTIASLAVGATATLTKTFAVPSGDAVDNVATACGKDPLQLQVCDTDDHHLVVVHPSIQVVKAGMTSAHVGDVVFYTFAVTNTGDVPLTSVVVTDNKLGAVGTIASLAVGGSTTITKDFTVPAGNAVDNIATACGNDPSQVNVCDTDDHHLVILHPAIQVVKSAATTAHVGDVVAYSFAVTNTGDVALTDVAVSDDKLGAVGTIPSLAVGATTTLTKNFTVPAGSSVDNIATVCGDDPLELEVCDTDDHHLVILHPAIDVVKSGPDAANVGDVVAYSFAVTNTGDVALTDVAVSDDKLGAVGTIPSLAVGATTTLTKNFTVPAGSAVDNIATACGDDPLALEVCDTDDHHLVIVHPAIDVVKSGPDAANVGDVVTYSFAVTNTGDVTLTNVVVTDDILGPLGTIASLAVGATTTLTKDFTVPAGVVGVDNTAVACGSDPLARRVCGDDSHHLGVTSVLGETAVRGEELARTGFDGARQLFVVGIAILFGLWLRRIGRRSQVAA